MGITLHNVSYSMDMGYGQFFNLRLAVAKYLDEKFAKLYREFYRETGDNNRAVEELNRYIESNFKDDCILDFLLQPDCEGNVSSKTCKRIYEVIKNYDNNYMYGYVYSNNTFTYFKNMIHDCAVKRRKLYWR